MLLLLQILGFAGGFFGAMWLLRWSMNKDIVITFKPFSVKIEKR